MSVLDPIVNAKRRELALAKARLPPKILGELVACHPSRGCFARALQDGDAPRIVSEVKRASPSAGVLRAAGWNAEELARDYRRGGASALSVLTDIQFFWGDPSALRWCKEASGLPVLRKDFIVDPYQVDESCWLGADAILLIVRILSETTLKACARRAQELGIDVLVEVHSRAELDVALAIPGAVVGVNHRDLDTLEIDRTLSLELRQHIPSDRIAIVESGVSRPEEVQQLVDHGFENFLIGEHLVRQSDPASALERLRASR